jgi:hypothetical protein
MVEPLAVPMRPDHFEHNNMNPSKPGTFDPKRVIYRLLAFDPVRGFYFRDPLKAFPWPNPTYPQIEDLCLHLATTIHVNGKPEEKAEDTPLSISVMGDAYLVLELAEDLPWSFEPSVAGITLGKLGTDAMKLHGALKHFNGKTFDAAGSKGCKFVFFATKQPEKDVPQAVNFNLVDAGGTPCSVDPDIRYPGNGGDVGEGP